MPVFAIGETSSVNITGGTITPAGTHKQALQLTAGATGAISGDAVLNGFVIAGYNGNNATLTIENIHAADSVRWLRDQNYL